MPDMPASLVASEDTPYSKTAWLSPWGDALWHSRFIGWLCRVLWKSPTVSLLQEPTLTDTNSIGEAAVPQTSWGMILGLWSTWLVWLVGFSVMSSDAIALMLVSSCLLWGGVAGYRQGIALTLQHLWQWLVHPKALLDQYVLLYLALIVLATAWSSFISSALIGWLKYSLMVIPCYGFTRIACHYLVTQKTKTPIKHWHPLYWVIGAGILQAGIGLYQYKLGVAPQATWVDPSTLPEHQLTRVFGTLLPLNPNLYAGFLLPTYALTLILGVIRPLWEHLIHPKLQQHPTHQTTKAISLKPLVLGVTLTGLLLLGILLSGCRGAYVSAGCMTLASYLALGHVLWYVPTTTDRGTDTKQRLKTWWLTLGGTTTLLASCALWLSPALLNRLLSIGKMAEDSSIAYRFHVYQSVLHMIQDHWLFGIGPGNDTFKKVYGFYMHSGFNALGAYSVPLEYFVELGLGGLLWFLGLGVLISICLMGTIETPPQDPKTTNATSTDTPWILLASGSAIAILLLHGFVDTVWFRPPIQCLMWILLGVFTTCWVHHVHPKQASA
ncbi:MAG: O-antigen ligase family protein [Vampirovibrionales bacterium]